MTVMIVLLVLVVVTAGGGYWALQSGVISQRGILNTLGLGTGEASVLNLTDGDISVSITSLDQTESAATSDSMTLKTTDSNSFTSLRPGRYRITFSYSVGGGLNQDCSMQVGSGDFYQFVAVNEGVAVINEKYTPSTVEDLNIASSALCKK